jgi:hypothetical protein
MKKLILTYLFFLGLQSIACDCIIYTNTNGYLSEVDMVFVGKVVDLIKIENEEIKIPEFLDSIPGVRKQWKTMNPNQYYARVLMVDNIKGKILRTDTLFFTSEFTNCDPKYELNQSYLFFADKTKNEQYIMTHCTPWSKLEDSKETIANLRK